MPALNLLPILFRSPPGAAGNHVVSMINGASLFNGRHIVTEHETKNVEHSIKYHNQDIISYHAQIETLINSGVKAIATHWSIQPQLPVYAVNAYWDDPQLSYIFACRDMLTVKPESVFDHAKQDNKLQLIFKSPIRQRKKWLIFMNNLVNYGEGSNSKLDVVGWNNFCIDNIFSLRFVDDLVNLCQTANLEVNIDFMNLTHKKWLKRNPPNDFTVRRAIRRLEKFIL